MIIDISFFVYIDFFLILNLSNIIKYPVDVIMHVDEILNK